VARAYKLGKRAVTAAHTRQRIIDAARDVISADGVPQAGLAVIAERAGVTRTTVYQQFGSREELLLAVVNDALDRADVRTVRKALQHRDAAKAARLLMRASTRFWHGEHRLFTNVKGLAELDEAAHAVDVTKEGVRIGHIRNLAYRLAEQGKLRDGCDEEHAMQIIHLLTSFETFDQLFRISKLGLEATSSILVEMLDGAVLAPDA
jgi:AcrR family transcriptional regulator